MRRRHYPLEELTIPAPHNVPELATPEQVEDEDTGVVTRQLFAAMQASPDQADVIVEKLVKRLRIQRDSLPPGGGSGGGGKRPDVQGWLRFALGALLALLGGWWTLSRLFDERPTSAQVEKMIEPAAAELREHDQQLRRQDQTLVKIDSAMGQLTETLSEVRQDVKELGRTR